MNPVEYFSKIIKEHDCNVSSVSEKIIENKETLIRCYINPWNGLVTVMEHKKNFDGSFDEFGRIIGSITVDVDDSIIIEIQNGT